jgi:hypothetical protein
VKLLERLAALRRTKTPSHLDAFASALSRFPLDVVEDVCTRLGETAAERGTPVFPRLDRLLELCRSSRVAQIADAPGSRWSLQAYADARNFDRWREGEIDERLARAEKHGRKVSRRQIEYELDLGVKDSAPARFVAWRAWVKQRAAGTLDCPGWCDECEGNRQVVRYADGSVPWSLEGGYGDDRLDNRAAEKAKRQTQNYVTTPCPTCRGGRLP